MKLKNVEEGMRVRLKPLSKRKEVSGYITDEMKINTTHDGKFFTVSDVDKSALPVRIVNEQICQWVPAQWIKKVQ